MYVAHNEQCTVGAHGLCAAELGMPCEISMAGLAKASLARCSPRPLPVLHLIAHVLRIYLLISEPTMVKQKNHTNRNQSYKNHRNGKCVTFDCSRRAAGQAAL